MSDQTLPHVHFEKRYAGEAPWGIPRPQSEIVAHAELEHTFTENFTILSITPTQYELLPRGEGEMFTAGGAKAYLLIARRR